MLGLNRGGYPKPGKCPSCKVDMIKNNPLHRCGPCAEARVKESEKKCKDKIRRRNKP